MTVGELCDALNGLDSSMEVIIGVEDVLGSGDWMRYEPLRFARTFDHLTDDEPPGELRVVLFS